MPYFGVLCSSFDKLLPYLKPAPRIWLIAKFCERVKIHRERTKMSKLRPKLLCLGIFGLGFWKLPVKFEIGTLEFVKNEFLTHTVNLGVGSAFSKSLRFSFSEGSGVGPLFKLYQVECVSETYRLCKVT